MLGPRPPRPLIRRPPAAYDLREQVVVVPVAVAVAELRGDIRGVVVVVLRVFFCGGGGGGGGGIGSDSDNSKIKSAIKTKRKGKRYFYIKSSQIDVKRD